MAARADCGRTFAQSHDHLWVLKWACSYTKPWKRWKRFRIVVSSTAETSTINRRHRRRPTILVKPGRPGKISRVKARIRTIRGTKGGDGGYTLMWNVVRPLPEELPPATVYIGRNRRTSPSR